MSKDNHDIDLQVSEEYKEWFNKFFELAHTDPLKAEKLAHNFDKYKKDQTGDDKILGAVHGYETYLEDITRLPEHLNQEKGKSADKTKGQDLNRDI